MATVDDAHKTRWNAVKTGIVYIPQNGIPTAWRQHPEWGSPLGPEIGRASCRKECERLCRSRWSPYH